MKELDRLEQRHREEMRREEEENSQRLKVQEKKIDHIVRAKQLEEMELRRQDNEAMIDNYHDIWTRDVERRVGYWFISQHKLSYPDLDTSANLLF